MKKIKTYEAACKKLGIDPKKLPDVSGLPEQHQKSIIAYYKLTIIAQVLNEGWKPNWDNYSEKKYYPWLKYEAGSGFSDGDYFFDCAGTDVGSRLCFKTSELAMYAAKQFNAIYNDYLTL